MLKAKHDHIVDNFLNKKLKYSWEFSIVIALILHSHDIWHDFVEFYADVEFEKASVTVSEELIQLTKYNRNMIKLTNKLFWKRSLTTYTINKLPIEAKTVYENIVKIESKFNKKLLDFINLKIKNSAQNVDYIENQQICILQTLSRYIDDSE